MDTYHHYDTKDYTFGLLLLTLREKTGLTQAAVAALIGVSEKAVYNWEAGSDYPTGMNLKKLIEVYVRKSAFGVGQEREEARAVWEQVSLHAPRRKAIFDDEWFTTLLTKQQQEQQSEKRGQRSQEYALAIPRRNGAVDWDHSPDISHFCGRSQELSELSQWILKDRCRVITLLGMGGIGKTMLATRLTHQMTDNFQYVLWRSLKNAPPLRDLLHECIAFFSEQQYHTPPNSTEGCISLLLDLFRTYRCMLVLDNVETALQVGQSDGRYREGYEGYERLIEQFAENKHQSCVLLTSREKLKITGPLESPHAPVRSLQVTGLNLQESQELLHARTLRGDEQAWVAIVHAYAGNPLALKMVSEVIRDLFGGDIAHFFQQGEIYFNGIRHLLDQQFERLSPLEQDLLYWFAIERDQVSIETLRADLIYEVRDGKIVEALHALYRRSLLEPGERSGCFTLQPVVLEYVTGRLVEQASKEIEQEHIHLIRKYALMQAQAKEYVRNSQVRLIIQPLIERLLIQIHGRSALEKHLTHLIESVRVMPRAEHGYGGGNLVNLLFHVKGDVNEADFSALAIREAYLQGVEARDTNFSDVSITTSVFTETFGSITSVAFSPDGRYIAAGSFNGEIRVWQVIDMKQVFTFDGHNGWIWSVTFSPDSKLLVSGGTDRTVKLWDVSSLNGGTCINTLQGHTRWVKSVACSPDGSLLASGSDDSTVRVWDLPSGQLRITLNEHTSAVASVAFSPDGTMLASGSEDATIKLWNVGNLQEGQHSRTLQGHTDTVASVAFSPDGTMLASGSEDATIKLWKTSTGRCASTLRGHGGRVLSVAFHRSNTMLASGSADQSGKLWDVRTGQCCRTFQGHAGTLWSVAFSPDGEELVTGSDDQTMRLWHITTGKCLRTLRGYTGMTLAVAFCQKGSLLVSGGEDASVRVWNPTTGHCLKTLRGHEGRVWTVACQPDATTIASAGHDRTIRLWDVAHGQCIHVLRGHTGIIWSVAFSPDGTTLASGSDDGTIKLWDVRDGRCLMTLRDHKNWVWSVAFSPDGTMLASGCVDRTIKLWNVRDGQCITTLHGHTEGVSAVVFHPDNATLLSGSYDQTIKVWHIDTAHCIETLHDETGAIVSLSCTPDGTTLLHGSNDRTIKVWSIDIQHKQYILQRVLASHTGVVVSVSVSPDETSFASGSEDGTIKLWSASAGNNLNTLRVDRPYERMNIRNVVGLTEAQKTTLTLLGAEAV